MSSKNTENLNLHAWVRTDVFSMDEFNENFDAIDKAVAAKAEQTALNAEIAARKNALDTERDERERADAAEIAARKSADATEKSARENALAALAGRVGALETSRLVCKFGEYVGTGDYSNQNPNRLDFDFKLLAIIIYDPTDVRCGGFPWVKGMGNAHCYMTTTGSSSYMRLKWEDRALEWYHASVSSTASLQLNVDGRTYKYLAIGLPD